MTFRQKSDGFTCLALKYPQADIYELYNYYLRYLYGIGEKLENDALVIEAAETARSSSGAVRDFIIHNLQFCPKL